MSRNSHALSTKFNILYNGDLALEQGVTELKTQFQDNYWELLPVERMQIKEEQMLPNETKNPNFERAEEKATKAIQKHSMNIQGGEKNPQMDEAHLLLGKARYYDQRFVPSLEAFNYVLYKYPKSSKIYEVKIWREKTNMRLENDQLAINNLGKLLKEIKVKEVKIKDQIHADANAVMAQGFLNLQEKDSAIAKLKLAKDLTKSNEEKSRYNFILAQLYESLNQPDSAFASYQAVIDMNRKAARQYVIHAHINQAIQNQPKKGDSILFLKKWNKLLADRENRPFLDALYHQKAKFYESQENFKEAKANYNLSLKKKSTDQYLIASNYRNLATIYFDEAKYPNAGKYYDSTLVFLKPRTREFNAIKKKRENLNDVIKYEAIAQANDSIISLFKLSSSDKVAYFEKIIEKLKIEDAKKQKELERLEQIKANSESFGSDDPIGSASSKNTKMPPSSPSFSGTQSDFYFYNTATIAFGKKQFVKTWGKRKLVDNWRISSLLYIENDNAKDSNEEASASKDAKDKAAENPAYSPEFYISQLPTSQIVIDSLAKERNFAYYQLGVIYKEKFKEYELAVVKLEKLLENNPEERLVLPSMYNLYKLYEILDKNKAIAMKNKIIAEFPESRYAKILSNPQDALAEDSDSPRSVYEALFKKYEERNFKEVYSIIDEAIDKFTGEEIIPKLELLKANLIGKLSGLDEYQKALNYVALSYPNVEEGKTAEKMIRVNLPKLRALQLGKYESNNWKVLYETKDFEDKNTKVLIAKINKFIKERSLDKLSISLDIYTLTDNFIVIHGMKSEETARGIASILKEYKDYKIQEKAIVISTENYTVVQIKKNLQDYLAGKVEENPTKPNWDGTLEKLPVALKEEVKKEEQVKNSAASKSQQSQKEETKKNDSQNPTNSRKMRDNEEEMNFGPPLEPKVPKGK